LFLAALFLVSTSSYFDRHIIAALLEPIKNEFGVSDTMLGLLSGFCFAVLYAVCGIPLARWADRGNRRTVITLALTVWSAMTALCGMAPAFWQLALARLGVGAAEAGAIAPAQSLIVDYFPPERRAMALSVFTAAGTTGSLLAFGLGGYLGATRGWRTAFLVAGLSGLVLAVFARIVLAEPRLAAAEWGKRVPAERLRDAFGILARKRSFALALVGNILNFLITYGGFVFIPAFLVRVMHAPLADVSVTYGCVDAVASVIGALGGGWLADRLGRYDVRWFAWLPAMTCTLAAPLYMAAFAVHEVTTFMVLIFFADVLLVGGTPPIFAAIHAVCGSARRAMAIGVVIFTATLIGGGLGPLGTGALSDELAATLGAAAGLRYSLMTVMSLLVIIGAVFYLCGRAMPRDLEP
jgi:predicted MFS family arabinose efflux permease